MTITKYPKLSLNNVSYSISKENPKKQGISERINLLESCTVSLNSSAIHVLIGPSGSGKSTLLYAINRLREIDAGSILLDGKDIREFNILNLRRIVGMVMQKSSFFDGTVADNILYGPKLWKKDAKEHPPVEHYLNLVGLTSDYALRDPKTLSGGQQQRVSLARTLANEPEILLLDELTSALDPQATEKMENLIVDLCQKDGHTIIWVTHDIKQAQRVASDITLLYNGKIIEHSGSCDFFKEPKTLEGRAFLNGKLEGEN